MMSWLDKEENASQCYFDLNSVSFTTYDTNIQADPTAVISHLGPQCPQGYGEDFLFDYTVKKWEVWRKCFQHQKGTVLKLCTGNNINKEANSGVVKKKVDVLPYTVCWRQQYTCFRGRQPRCKVNENRSPQNAPGSRLSRCRATLNVRLLKLEHGEILHVTFPLSSDSGHALKSLADMHAYQPLPEVIERVESLVTNSYLSQVSLKLSLKGWVMKELIPVHLKKGIIDDIASQFDRLYHPTAQDLRNMTKGRCHQLNKEEHI